MLQWRDVIYILNDAMDCKNNSNELTASGSLGNRFHMFYRTFYQTKIKEFVTERVLSQKRLQY